jgi:alanine dehydrogenase
MTILLDDNAVRSSFDWRRAIESLRTAYAGPAEGARYPARTMARGDGSWLRTLSGAPADTGLMGVKLIAAAAGAHRVSYLIALFDQQTAELVALLDAHSITGYRTAATSALAADLLAPAGSLSVAVIGSGFEAQNHVRALAAIRELEAVHVYSPRPESRARFAVELADLALPLVATQSPQAAVAEASLIVCAARSRDETPTLLGDWLHPGMTVLSIGSTLPEQREVDSDVIGRSDLIVADMLEEVLDDTGDLIAARLAGIDAAAKTFPLADLVAGRHPGREKPDQIALYKSVGSAVQDLAVATMCLGTAEQAGRGTVLPSTIQPVTK